MSTTQNKIKVEKKKSPTEVLFKLCSYLQRWKILLGLAEISKVEVEQMGRNGVLVYYLKNKEASRYRGADVKVAREETAPFLFQSCPVACVMFAFESRIFLLVIFSCFLCKLVSPASCRHYKHIFLISTVILVEKKGILTIVKEAKATSI